ncbi:tigger transposable element-derived protein 4-like, partial [Aphis craccivora]
MDLIDQKDKLEVINVDVEMVKKPSRHDSLLPDTIRAILVGPSGSGKTNIMYNLIPHTNGLRFENIYSYSKTSNQEKFILLKKKWTIVDKVIKPNLVKKNSMIIFDDVICGPKSVIREYFSICRHSGANSLVRDNSNFLIILKQNDTNLRHIFNDYSSADMDFSEFRKMCNFCWNHSDYGFLVID